MSLPRPCRLFLFDLDGTLIDSREDIARTLNAVLARVGHPPLSMSEVLRFVGDGTETLIQRALSAATCEQPDSNLVSTCVRLMLQEYETHLLDSTHLYPGVRETLDALHGSSFGLVSNKMEVLCRRILQAFDLADRFSVVLGGDSLPQRKPAPAPILEAMACCSALPSETVMVGDSRTDILAGRAAGVITCGVSCGFRGRDELQGAGCDVIIDHFSELLKHFSAVIS
jgi:phosphoglycolate phosphatase